MARLVKKEAMGPIEVKVGGESKWICMCGLSKNQQHCDGSHKMCEGEQAGKLYNNHGCAKAAWASACG